MRKGLGGAHCRQPNIASTQPASRPAGQTDGWQSQPVTGQLSAPHCLQGTDEGALDYALNRALDAWHNDRPWFRSLQRRVMLQDWSWNKPAIDYIQLYYAAMK